MAVRFMNVDYKNIFNKINLEIEENQIIAIVGKNGSGKTTLFDLMYGLDTNFEGEITVLNDSIYKSTKQEQLNNIRKNIFYLKQNYNNQLFNVNILEDIKYNVGNFDNDKLSELLKLFDLDAEILKKQYTELSDGEIKKILLIIMVISDKKIILLDDVTNGLDSKSKKNLVKLLKKEKRDGKIIIVSSQDTDFLFTIASKIVVIDNGTLKFEKDKNLFFDNKLILNKHNLEIPNTLKFRDIALKRKKIKLLYRDSINDLIKDIYRNAK